MYPYQNFQGQRAIKVPPVDHVINEPSSPLPSLASTDINCAFPKASVDARTARVAEESRRADGTRGDLQREVVEQMSHRGSQSGKN